jgi:hypothetical protein
VQGQTSGTQQAGEMADPEPLLRDALPVLFEKALESFPEAE